MDYLGTDLQTMAMSSKEAIEALRSMTAAPAPGAAPAPAPAGALYVAHAPFPRQTIQEPVVFPHTTEDLHKANRGNGVDEGDINAAPEIVKDVVSFLREKVKLSPNHFAQLCDLFKMLRPESSEEDVMLECAQHYEIADNLSDENSRLPFPFQHIEQMKRTRHFLLQLDAYSENTWSNLFYSEVIGDTLHATVREVNRHLDLAIAPRRFNLLFDAPWKPGRFRHEGEHKGSKSKLDGVPGEQIPNSDGSEAVMLKPDMFINRHVGIDFSFLLAEFKRLSADLSDMEKLLMEGFITLAARDVYMKGTNMHESPLMWVPLLYCSATEVQISVMWIEVDPSDGTKLRYPYVEILPSTNSDAFDLAKPSELLEFTKVLTRLAEKVAEQMMCKPAIHKRSVLNYVHLASCVRSKSRKTAATKRKRAEPEGGDDDDDGHGGDANSEDDDNPEGGGGGGKAQKSKKGKQRQNATATRKSPRFQSQDKTEASSPTSDVEALAIKWGAKSFRQIDPRGKASKFEDWLAGMFGPPPAPPRNPVHTFVYDDHNDGDDEDQGESNRVTVVKFFYYDRTCSPEDVEEEIGIQSAVSELPAAHVPRILRVKRCAAYAAVEMEHAGDSRPRACDLHELKVMCRQLASALDAVHAHGYVHCDLKPDNVALRRNCGDGVESDGGLLVSILDWGWARKLEPGEDSFDGDGRGTDGFMAPEMEAHEVCTSAVDIYSLGLTFDYFAGRLPRVDEDHACEWKSFRALVRDMTHADPAHRPTAAQLLGHSFLLPLLRSAPGTPNSVSELIASPPYC